MPIPHHGPSMTAAKTLTICWTGAHLLPATGTLTPCRHFLFVWRIEEQSQAGIRYRQGTCRSKDWYHREFLEIIKPLFGREREKKELAKVFQALRIEVNREMEALKEMLYAATEALKPGGRLVVITYHSLEDRMVKTS